LGNGLRRGLRIWKGKDMNEQKIGEIAGEVWRFVERHGGQVELDSVRRQVRGDGNVSADMGAGWLAREGKISFQSEGNNIRVALRR
jgi:hypothetical protein